MKKILNNRTVIISFLIVLIYCLAILIEKRINPNNGLDFNLWSPYYLIYTIIFPLVLLLPIRLLPSSRYTKFVLKNVNRINKIIVISTSILLVWLLSWYAMIGMGDLMSKSLNIAEAESASLTAIRNNATIKTRIGQVDSTKLVSNLITSKTANFNYTIYGKDLTMNVEILLSRDQEWIVDTTIIKKGY